MTALGLKKLLERDTAKPLPAFFFGHGSPMNLVAQNQFTATFRRIGEEIERPVTILCVSAHWVTEGSLVQASPQPKQIFDFSGFPNALYQIHYVPPGHPEAAARVAQINSLVQPTNDWGIDHGTWTILHHMFPKADVPVFQLSLNRRLTPMEHLRLAASLKELRRRGVLILGSGNIVHNLRAIDWNPDAPAHPWASDYESLVLQTLQSQNLSHAEKVKTMLATPLFAQSHPTAEHFLPLVYALGVTDEGAQIDVIAKGIQNSSISMAALRVD